MWRLLFVAALLFVATAAGAQSPLPDEGGNAASQPAQPAPIERQQAVPAPESAAPPAVPPATAPAVTPQPAAPQFTSPAILPDSFVKPVSQLQELIDTRLAKFIARKNEREAVEAFYRARDYQPLWSENGVALLRTGATIEHLQNVGSEGLEPRDYPTPDFSKTMSEEAAAANDLKLTASVLAYARHASSGRVSFTRVSGAILYPDHAADPADVLARIAAAADVRPVLRAFEPQQPGFRALQAELAKLLAAPASVVEEAPQADRRSRHSKAAHSQVRRDAIGIVIANMERWRWLPRDLGSAYVMVNVPDYSLGVFKNGAPVWQTKIVVGKPGEAATPLLSETMKYLTINPTWNVPPSIIRNEYLPALERDPGALDRIGLKVSRNHDGSLRVYQPPGSDNALGRIRFNFPNPFLVYQHDTPNKSLFARDTRALSHGCMRVQNPEKYAEVLLSLSQPNDGFTIARITSMYGDQERTIKLEHFIPVHVTYQTAFVDQTGRLNFRDDIYGLDAAVLKLMRGGERAIIDTPIARNYRSSSAPVMARLPSRPAREDTGWNDSRWSPDGWNRSDYGRAGRAYAADPYRRGIFDRALGGW